jgi:hypothetical protein
MTPYAQNTERKSAQENTKTLPSIARLEEAIDRLRAAGERAADYISRSMVQDKARNFLDFVDEFTTDLSLRTVDALGYALDLALFTPAAISGQTAIDRMIRNKKGSSREEAEAASTLKNAVFRLIALTGTVSADAPEQGLFAARDLASGENIVLFDRKIAFRAGARWALRTCLFDGVHIAIGAATPLDDGIMEVARKFIDEGRGLKNPSRCAEALYRHFIRYGDPRSSLSPDQIDALDRKEFPFGAEDGPLHDLAARWSVQETLPEPGSDDLRLVRAEAYSEPVHESLFCLYTARKMNLPRLAAAYERILGLQLETIHRRHGAGIRVAHETLDSLTAEIAEGIAEGTIAPAAAPLFEELCRRAKLAGSGKTANIANRDELDKVLTRIQGLRSKTVERSCTEAEALLAAGKVAELLDRYGLSLSEVDMKEQSCSGEGIETDRRRRSPLDDSVSAIAAFCDCRTWYEMTPKGHIRHVFFGLPADVAGARCLYEKIEEAYDTETEIFKRSTIYGGYHASHRRSATTSFQTGLMDGIGTKLDRLKEARNTAARASGGRDLVSFKNTVIEDELSSLGLNLRTIHANHGKRVLSGAYRSGHVIGESMDWQDKLGE